MSLLAPLYDSGNWPVVATFVACLVLQHVLSPLLLARFYGARAWKRMSPAERSRLNVRLVSAAHALVAFAEIPGFFSLPASCFPSPGHVDSYCFSANSQAWFQVALGYYLWDLFVSVLAWEVQFIVHGALTAPVFFFALRPFLHVYGRFFHGVFALSTPWLHLRELVQKRRPRWAMVELALSLTFALSFVVVRVLLGLYVSFFWWRDMVLLISSGEAHSVGVICFCLFANGVLMVMQLLWLGEIIRQAKAMLLGAGGDAKKQSGKKKNKKKK